MEGSLSSAYREVVLIEKGNYYLASWQPKKKN